jgi:site-specific recombinase XerD
MDIKPFASFLVARKGLMPTTVFGYSQAVKRIVRVIGRNPSPEKLEKFVTNLYSSEMSYHHKLNNVLALEKYLEFLGSPIRFGRQRKPKPIIKDTLTEGEITKLLFNCKNERERAILSIFAYSGLRNKEVCNLKVKDFLWNQNAIRVIQGKFAKDGISEIPPECSKIVIDYLNLFPRDSEKFLFTTLRKDHQMDTRDMRKLVKVVARRSKISKRVYPHLLRHSLAANMILRGADVISLKNQLRHSWLETTLHYANSIVFVEKNRYQKFAPSYI